MKVTKKKDIIKYICDDVYVAREDVELVFESTLRCIADSLAKGKGVVVRNFGAFQLKDVKARVGRNPQKPKIPIQIPAHKAVKFRASDKIKERINAKAS